MRYEYFGTLPAEVVAAAAGRGRKKVSVFEPEDGPAFMKGTWTDFRELATEILDAANSWPNKCDYRWSNGKRFRQRRLASAVTGGEEV